MAEVMGLFDRLAAMNELEARTRAEAISDAWKPTPAQAAWIGGVLTPGSSAADVAGELPPWPSEGVTVGEMLTGQKMPSLKSNIEQRKYFDAAMQGLGVGGDALSILGPPGLVAGALAKSPRLLRGVLKGVENIPEDVARLKFTGTSAPEQLAEGTARTIKTTGKYRGAPRDITSGPKLGAMRKRLKDYIAEGSDGRLWYENTNEWLRQVTADRPGVRDRYAASAAITSQGTQVGGNAPMAMKGYNQALLDEPVVTGRFPATQGKSIEGVFTGTTSPLGPKREPFFEALIQDPNRLRQTNDVRQARAFGYTKEDGSIWDQGLGTAQHRFMDEETASLVEWANKKKVGGHADWDRDRIQAAIWIAQKAEQEGTTIAEAGRMFQDVTPRAIVRPEAIPSEQLGHLPGLLDDPEALAAYSQRQREVLSTPQKTDYLTAQTGALTGEVVPGPGSYGGVSRPADAIPVLVGKSTTEVVDPVTGKVLEAMVIDPASRTLVESTAAARGLLGAQETVGYTTITRAPNAATRNAVEIDLGRTISGEEMNTLQEVLGAQFKGLIPLHQEKGVTIIVESFDALKKLTKGTPGGKTPKWQKDLSDTVTETLDVTKKDLDWGLNTGGLVGDVDTWTYKPSAYLEALEAPGPTARGLLDEGMKNAARRLETLDQQLLKEYPSAGERKEIVSRVRQALIEKGVAGVRELVQKGIVPAVVLGALGVQTIPQESLPRSGLL